MTIRTFKIPYKCSDINFGALYAQISKEQSNTQRIAYNRFVDSAKESTIRALFRNGTYNNISTDTWFQQSAIKQAQNLYKAQLKKQEKLNLKKLPKVQFARSAFLDYLKGKITKQELQEQRNFGIYSEGESSKKANRKFCFVSLNEVLFKLNRSTSFKLDIKPSKNQMKYIQACIDASNQKQGTAGTAVSVRLSKEYIYITFDVSFICDKSYKPKANRVMGIDMNPNRYAFCIKDQNKLLKSESFDLMSLRLHAKKGFASNSKEKKYLHNKKTHEVIELAHEFIKQAKALHVEAIALENLDGMRSATSNKHFNRAVNNDFKRRLFRDVIEKLCTIHSIKFIEINSMYTSFMGCVLYGQALPDPISAAACVADAGIIHLQNQVQKHKYFKWFNNSSIDASLYNKSKYIQSWNSVYLSFASIPELYKSVKSLVPKGSMYSSYHAFLGSYCSVRTKFKSEKSSVKRIYVI